MSRTEILWPLWRIEARSRLQNGVLGPIFVSVDPVFPPGKPDRLESSPAVGLGE